MLYILIKFHRNYVLGDGSWQIFREFRGASWGEGSRASVIGRYDVLARAREKPHVERTDNGGSRLFDAC